MPFVSADRVRETTATTGTGSFSLAGAVTGFRSFDSVLNTADTCEYACFLGAEWEVGLGTFTSPSTLARTTIIASSNGGAAVNFSAGTKEIFLTASGPWLYTKREAIPAAGVEVSELGAATYENLKEIHDLTRSAGHLDGGQITDAGGGNIAVAAGQGFIRATNDDTSTLFAFDWPAPSNIAIADDTIRYVRVDYNGGSPAVTVSTSEDYDYRTGFPLGFVIRENGIIYINETPHSAGRGVGRLSRRNYEVEGRSRANAIGGLIIGESGTKSIAVTAGVTWLRGVRELFAAFDSNVSDSFDRYYRDGGGGWTREAAQTVLPLNTYDDGDGTLGTVGNNNYGNYWIYLGPGNNVVLVYGRGNFNTLALALASQPPSDLPLRLQVGSLLLGRFTTLRSGASSSVAAIETAFTTEFVPAPVTDHGDLAGLADDDHPQYYQSTLGVVQSVSAGTQSASGNVIFSNSHGVSFGLNNGTITGSHNALTSQSNQAFNAGGVSSAFQTVVFQDSNGVSFSNNAGSIRASHNALTSQSNQAFSAGAASSAFQTLIFQDSNGISFSNNAGSLRATYTVPVTSNGILDVSTATQAGTATSRFAMHDHQHRGIRAIDVQGIASTFFGNLQMSAAGAIVLGTAGNTTAGTIQISAPAQTVQTQSNVQGVIVSNTTYRTGDVSFSNANGISFGSSAGQAVTASYTRPVVSNAIASVGSATGSGTNTSRFAADDHVHAGVFSMGVSDVGNTVGDTRVDVGRFVLAGGPNITLSQATAAGALNTISFSAGAGAGDGGNILIAGTRTAGSNSSVLFDNANGITFGLNAPLGSIMTASHNALTTAALSNHSHGASGQNGSFGFQTLSFSNANGISFGSSAGPAITASHNALTSQSNQAFSAGAASSAFQTLSFQDSNSVSFSNNAGAIRVTHDLMASSSRPAFSAGAASSTFQTVVFQDSNGISFSNNAGSIRASHNALTTAALSNHSHGASGQNGSFGFQTLSFSNANGISFGTSAGNAMTASHNALTTAALSNHSHGASASNGSFGFQTLNFSNANNVTFGTSAGGIMTASVAAPGAAAENNWFTLSNVAPGANSSASGSTIGLSGINLTLSGTQNSQIVMSVPATSSLSATGLVSLSTNVSTISIGVGPMSYFAVSNTTQSSSGTIDGRSISLHGAGNASVGVSNGSIVISASGGGGALPIQRWNQILPFRFSLSNLTNITAMSNVPFFQPMRFDGDMTISRINYEMSRSTSGSNLFSVTGGFYTYVNATQLSLLTSFSGSYSNTLTASVSGIRRFGFGPPATFSLPAGGYVVGMMFNAGANTASMNYSIRGHSGATQIGAILPGDEQYNTATSYNIFPFFGRLSNTTAAFPGSVGDNQVRGQFGGASAPINAWLGFNND